MKYFNNFFLLFIIVITYLYPIAFISCPEHKFELLQIKIVAEESICNAHSSGGKLFNDSILLTTKDIVQFQLRYANKYSDYSKLFDEYLLYCHPQGISSLYSGKSKITEMFSELYTKCIKNHGNLTSRFQLGKLYFDQGYFEKCYSEIQAVLESGILNSEVIDKKNALAFDLIKGCIELEDGQYEKSINTLSNLIKKDPNNKEAYFSRAQAYFEIGLFEESLSDYLLSEKSLLQLKQFH